MCFGRNNTNVTLYLESVGIWRRGSRIAMRNKVSDNLICGVRIVDGCLPIGRGQRQLILGDRYTGKSSIVLSVVLSNGISSVIAGIDGFGSFRLIIVYCVICNNLSKTKNVIEKLVRSSQFIWLVATQSSSNVLISSIMPMLGISISELMRNRIIDVVISYDDLSKHSKSYRQISLIIGNIVGRDSYPSEIFNVHSSLLERSSCSSNLIGGGSISSFPIIETVNSNLSEYISTNVISITDGQIFNSRDMFVSGIKPSIESGLSVSRIGSNAQCKNVSSLFKGIKNDITNLRNESSEIGSIDYKRLKCVNLIMSQEYLLISSIEISVVVIAIYQYNNLIVESFVQLVIISYLISSFLIMIGYLSLISKCLNNNFIISFLFFSLMYLVYYI